MTLKGPEHQERRFAQAGRLELSPRGSHPGAGGGRDKRLWGGAAVSGPRPGPQIPAKAPPRNKQSRKSLAIAPRSGPTRSGAAPRGGDPLFKLLETPERLRDPAQRRRPHSLTAHPPAPPASPSSSNHSTLLSPRLL